MKRLWLKDWPWGTVVTINAGLCREKKALHKPTSDGYAQKLVSHNRTFSRITTPRIQRFCLCVPCTTIQQSLHSLRKFSLIILILILILALLFRLRLCRAAFFAVKLLSGGGYRLWVSRLLCTPLTTASNAGLGRPARSNNRGYEVRPLAGQSFSQESPSVTPQKVTRLRLAACLR